MKFILLTLLITSCASIEKLENSQSCQVWKNQKIVGPRSVQVEGNSAKYEGSSEEVTHFNKKCTTEEAAVGAIAIWAGRSKDAGRVLHNKAPHA